MPAKKIALVWFKTNLRLRDNECLAKAIAENDEIIPFYCFDDRVFRSTVYGFKKTGDFRLKFLKESLQNLDSELRAAGSGLIILQGIPAMEIAGLAMKFGARSIYAEKVVAPEELNTEKAVKAEFARLNCSFFEFECRNLFQSSDLPFAIKQLPGVFTEFRKKTENITMVRPVFKKPSNIVSPGVVKSDLKFPDVLTDENITVDPRAAIQFKGGAKAAHERLQFYFYQTRALSSYKQTRNGMVGERYSSKFSAWLALGCISAKEIYEEVKNYEASFGANESTYWLIFELLWRDYFGFCFQKEPVRYFLKSEKVELKVNNPAKITKALDIWINGKTGVPFIDANMIELKLTGFMSNRGRQNVASYFCNDLKLDWRYGAAYFEQQLVDYDVCNNWGNWAYLAGVGNDPRNNRYFNIEKQAATYDADHSFRELWLNGKR